MPPLWLYKLYSQKGVLLALIKCSVFVYNLVGWVIILCVFGVPYLLFLSYRLGVWLWLSCRHGGKVELMAGCDAIYTLRSVDRHNSKAIVVGWIAVDGCVDICNFKERIRKRIQEDRWFQRLTFCFQFHLGFAVWKKDETFSVDHHVKLIAEPERTSFKDLIEELQCQDFEVDQSPWEILVLGSGEKTTLIIRWHHCLADGPGMMNGIIRLILDEGSTFPTSKIPERIAPNLKTFFTFLESIFHMPTIFPWLFLIPDRNRLSVTHPTKRKRIFFSDPLPLDPLKRIAKTLACTINDIFISCMIQGYKETLLGSTDTLSVAMAVSLRGESPEICNRAIAIRTPFPVSLDGDARIHEIRKMTRCLKSSSDILCTYTFMHTTSNALLSWLLNLCRRVKISGGTSNMPLSLPPDARVQDLPVSSVCAFAPTLLEMGDSPSFGIPRISPT
ncbi:unnamed protein product [Darwinula stevensoni]|uniref:diacylglycerol O-acyltransferase n=1 Tax=Darwinula stevensoni TaxID=69355 RepID=A0A7R8XBC2_9CRUS|nr:unnamed protein product [Darwinula stevensoni]CAG0892701.1 unnamed protein product [Darwinula stevensoni]